MRTKNNLSRTLLGRVAMTVIVTALTIFASTTKAWAINREISVGTYEHGTVTTDKESAAQGETVTLTVIPEVGYHLATIFLTDGQSIVSEQTIYPTQTATGSTKYTFTVPETDEFSNTLQVHATFEEGAALTVTASPEEGGTFRVDGSKLYVTPAPRYYLASVTREGTIDQLIIIAPADGEPYYPVSATDYITITFGACTNNVRVKFNMNGHGGEYFTQNGTIDYTIDKPTDPTEEGLVFGGWYMDADGTIPYDFNSVLKDTLFYSIPHQYYTMNLYAKWLVYESGNCGKVDSNAGLDGSEVTWSGYKNVHTNVFDEISISGNGEIMQDAFINKQNIKSVVINDGVTSIGQGVFYNCGLLASVNIPASVTSIGQNAFGGCWSLVSVSIPASVTSIGEGAFYNCTGLTSVTIPASVTSIGQGAFQGCTGLTSVTIPASVTSIGQGAFYGCSGLTSVIIYASSLETYGSAAFYQSTPTRNIYVFENSVDTYKEGWKNDENFVNSIVAIPASNLAVTNPVNENPKAENEYWSTYYHPAANVKINTNGVEIYKATLNDAKTSVTLTKVDGNVIKAGQAVMLKATGSGALSMELTPEVPTGDYSGNDLKGGNTVQAGYDAYTLAAENNTIGFYKFNGTLNASKAHLEIPQGSTSGVREFIGFDGDATRLKEERINNKEIKSEWYMLSGARLSGVPTKKGVYIYKGKKVIR